MILESLNIDLEKYGKDKGKYLGTIAFTSETGKLAIKLTPEHCHQIFEICAEALIDQAKRASQIMTTQIIETKQIEE